MSFSNANFLLYCKMLDTECLNFIAGCIVYSVDVFQLRIYYKSNVEVLCHWKVI